MDEAERMAFRDAVEQNNSRTVVYQVCVSIGSTTTYTIYECDEVNGVLAAQSTKEDSGFVEGVCAQNGKISSLKSI